MRQGTTPGTFVNRDAGSLPSREPTPAGREVVVLDGLGLTRLWALRCISVRLCRGLREVCCGCLARWEARVRATEEMEAPSN